MSVDSSLVSTPQGVVQVSSKAISCPQMPIKDYIVSTQTQELPLDAGEDHIPDEEDDSDQFQSMQNAAETAVLASVDLKTPPDSPKIPSFRPIDTQIPANLNSDMTFRVPTAPAQLPKPRPQPEKPREEGPLSSAFFTGRGWNGTKKYPNSESKPMSFATSQTVKTALRKENKEVEPLETPGLYLKAKENAASLPWFRLDPSLFNTANSASTVVSDTKLSSNQANTFPSTAPRYQVSFALPKLSTPAPVFAPPLAQYSPGPALQDSLYGSALKPPTLFRDLQSPNSADKPPTKALSDVSNTLPQAENKPRSLLSSLEKLAYPGPPLDDFESLFRDI